MSRTVAAKAFRRNTLVLRIDDSAGGISRGGEGEKHQGTKGTKKAEFVLRDLRVFVVRTPSQLSDSLDDLSSSGFSRRILLPTERPAVISVDLSVVWPMVTSRRLDLPPLSAMRT